MSVKEALESLCIEKADYEEIRQCLLEKDATNEEKLPELIPKAIETCRTHHQSEQFIIRKRKEIEKSARDILKSTKKKYTQKRIEQFIEDRAKFCFLYQGGNVLDKILSCESKAFQNKEKRRKITIARCKKFLKKHTVIKKKTYPYQWEGYSFPMFDAKIVSTGKIVGYIQLEENYIFDISVDPEFYHQGIAQMLLHEAFVFLKKEHNDVHLDVRETNVPATQFYEKIGFEIVERFFPDYYDYHGGFRMVGNLSKLISSLKRNKK